MLWNQVHWGYFWPTSQLFCLNLPTFFCLSVRHLIIPKRGLEGVVVARQASGPDHTPMHAYRIHTDPSRENKSMLGDLFQQLSEWLTVSPSVLHIHEMAPSVQWHKRTTEVCVREVITAFHCFFFCIHTQIQGYWHSRAAKSHKHAKNTKLVHTESMGKFLTTFKSEGRSLTSWIKKTLP